MNKPQDVGGAYALATSAVLSAGPSSVAPLDLFRREAPPPEEPKVPPPRDYKPEELAAAIHAGEGSYAAQLEDERGVADWATVVRLGGVGDNLIASSVLPGLKKRFRHLEVIASRPQACVFYNNPHIDKLEEREPGDPPWGQGPEWHGWFASRAKGSAFFVNLSHSCETMRALLPVQTAFYWPEWQRRKMCGQNYLETVADICGIGYDDIAPGFFPTEMERKQAEEKRETLTTILGRRTAAKTVIGWVLSGTRVDKIWPNAPIAISRIIKELGASIVVLGAPGRDFELARQIQENVRMANATDVGYHVAISPDPERPSWPIRRVLTMAQHCDLIVTPDTGPGWAVAQCDMPKIVMLSHASAENIVGRYWKNTTVVRADPRRVPCQPCHLLHDTLITCRALSGSKSEKAAACMEDVPANIIVETVARLLPRT